MNRLLKYILDETKREGISNNALEEWTGVSNMSVSYYRREIVKDPHVDALYLLAEGMQLRVAVIRDWVGKPEYDIFAAMEDELKVQGMDKKDLAQKIGMHFNSIRGCFRRKKAALSTLEKAADCLGIKLVLVDRHGKVVCE